MAAPRLSQSDFAAKQDRSHLSELVGMFVQEFAEPLFHVDQLDTQRMMGSDSLHMLMTQLFLGEVPGMDVMQ